MGVLRGGDTPPSSLLREEALPRLLGVPSAQLGLGRQPRDG